MWQEFQALTQTSEWEEDGGLTIERVTGLEGPYNTFHALTVDLRVAPGPDTLHQQWRLRCDGVVSHSLRFEWAGELELLDQHSLLWPHRHPRKKLWFSGRADDVPAIVGALFQAHVDLCGEWFAFEKFLSSPSRLSGLLASTGGLLAEGPQNVLEIYSQVLAAHGVSGSLTGWAHQSLPDVRLVLMGRSFVVCHKAEIELVSNEPTAP